MENKRIIHNLIGPMQKIALYETKARFYLVGSNNTQTKFRVLKIDRMESKELIVIDDKIEYTQKEIRDLLTMIDIGNRPRQGQKSSSGLNRTVSAFGIVGFVKFLEGYYLILITKRRRVAVVGYHTIYKIEDTSMIYISAEGYSNPDETKYLKIFQNVDLSSNFYFSYSYDITHTLQYNMAPCHKFSLDDYEEVLHTKTGPFWNPQLHSIEDSSVEIADNFLDSLRVGKNGNTIKNIKMNSPFATKTNSSFTECEIQSELKSSDEYLLSVPQDNEERYGILTKPNWKFVWNSYLLEPVDLHSDWILYITHGFVGQSNVSVYGRPVYLTLIARRSQKFAGTRFLKRGANCEGNVANEVETEQIVYDSSVSSFFKGHFTSFVQLRGSVPSQWSQDISKMVPKPLITVDSADPYCHCAGQHFNQLLRRYGAPIIILNLVKKREQRRHESILSEEFSNIVSYLNQFLSPEHEIINISFDMAHINKLKEANVLHRLAQIAYSVVSKIGIFENFASYYCHKIHSHNRKYYSIGGLRKENGATLQTGVVRVNCVDCLDRTNTAQFALGKCALAFQLYILGILESPTLEFDTDSVRMLEELYEDHGDTLALQYGGSQLVHRIKTYRKIDPLSSHSRDIMQTLSRYYSNTFSDADKQNAINLFLGIYKANKFSSALWELPTDYYLHNPVTTGHVVCHRNLYSCWWDKGVHECLPYAYDERLKGCDATIRQILKTEPSDECIDGFFDRYRPFEFTTLTDLLSFTMSHSVRDFMPNFSTDYSPFSVRVRPGKRRESQGEKLPNPSITGISSTTSASSGTSETDSGDSSEEEHFGYLDSEESSSSSATFRTVTFESLFSTMKQTYGIEIQNPSDSDMKLYKRYVNMAKLAGLAGPKLENIKSPLKCLTLFQKSSFAMDSCYHIVPPAVSKIDKELYKGYVQTGKVGPRTPSQRSLSLYYYYNASKFR